MPQPRENHTPTDTSGIASAQGDIAVNLFVVLLVVISLLSVTAASRSDQGFLSPLLHSSPSEMSAAPFKSWQPILPTHPKILVRGDYAYLLDFNDLAVAFAAGKKAGFGEFGFDTSRLLPNDPDPSGFEVSVLLDRETLPANFSNASVRIDKLNEPDADENALHFIKTVGGLAHVDVFYYDQTKLGAQTIAAYLLKNKIAVRLVLLRKDYLFGFASSGRRSGLEESFK